MAEQTEVQRLEASLEHAQAVQRALAAGLAFYLKKPLEEVLRAAEDVVSENEAVRRG